MSRCPFFMILLSFQHILSLSRPHICITSVLMTLLVCILIFNLLTISRLRSFCFPGTFRSKPPGCYPSYHSVHLNSSLSSPQVQVNLHTIPPCSYMYLESSQLQSMRGLRPVIMIERCRIPRREQLFPGRHLRRTQTIEAI